MRLAPQVQKGTMVHEQNDVVLNVDAAPQRYASKMVLTGVGRGCIERREYASGHVVFGVRWYDLGEILRWRRFDTYEAAYAFHLERSGELDNAEERDRRAWATGAESDEIATWVARAKAGDQSGMEELFRRYQGQIYSFLYRMMGDPDDASDLTQDTFVKAFRAIGRTSDDLNVSAWLHRIAANTAMDVLRRRARMRFSPWEAPRHDHLLLSRPTDDPERAVLSRETQATVQVVLTRMTPRHRVALVLREYEGLSCDEIGRKVGLSRSAVKSMLFRAREEFRRVYAAVTGEPARTPTPRPRPVAPPRVLTAAERAERILALWRAGWTMRAIIREERCHHKTVSAILRRAGEQVVPCSRRRHLLDDVGTPLEVA